MANDEHLALLKQGVGAWNKWREKNPDIAPDLRQADLRRASLYGADLNGADLRQAELGFANLRRANLRQADLSNANLRQAHLQGAFLNKPDFTGANLVECSVHGVCAWDLGAQRLCAMALRDILQRRAISVANGA
jgi:uncharacterized protein YjbI with pentapeptide repeats